jgi:putative tryptophan/tyrosine transport system permease protein
MIVVFPEPDRASSSGVLAGLARFLKSKGFNMTLLIGALTIGFILSLLALGVFISFRIFDFPDITADGSITLGASVTAVLLVRGVNPLLATAAGFFGGMLAGAATGTLHTKFKINGLLSGILVMTALYSVNLHVMGKSNVPLLSQTTLATTAEAMGKRVTGDSGSVNLLGWDVAARDASVLVLAFVVIALVGWALYVFFRTNLGTAMRATGDNQQMIRALGVNVGNMIILGLSLSNGLIALSGALLAQYQGFADVQMGIGMVVWGLASVIIGEALVGTPNLGLTITGAVMGSVLFRLLVAIALRWGLNPNDLKLITAGFVFVALILPNLLTKLKTKRTQAEVVHA